jgi:hypothetical protein
MMTPALAKEVTGGLSKPSKMPGYAYSIPAEECKVGSRLRKIKGSVCEKCYALKGRYVFGNVKKALRRRFESLSNPLWVEAMAFQINQASVNVFRFQDSGDLQSLEHLEKIAAVCRLTPDVRHWLPTREYAIVTAYKEKHGSFPDNLNIRLSAYMVDGPLPEGAANRLGVTMSGVTSDPSKVSCPAYKQGGVCGSCRACWDKTQAVVMYPKH